MTKTVYRLVAGAQPTTLTTSFNPSSDTQFTVESVEWIPTSPNHVTIRDGVHFTTILYSSITDNTISFTSVVTGETSYTFPIGSIVMRTVDTYDFEVLDENKVNIYQGTSYAGKTLIVGTDGNVTLGSPSGSITFADILGSPSDNANLSTALNSKVTKNTSQSSPSALAFEMGSDANGLYYWDA